METVKPGQRFLTKRKGFEWIVDDIVTDPFRIPHVRVRRAGDQTTQKLLALSVLTDQRFYQPMETGRITGEGKAA